MQDIIAFILLMQVLKFTFKQDILAISILFKLIPIKTVS